MPVRESRVRAPPRHRTLPAAAAAAVALLLCYLAAESVAADDDCSTRAKCKATCSTGFHECGGQYYCCGDAACGGKQKCGGYLEHCLCGAPPPPPPPVATAKPLITCAEGQYAEGYRCLPCGSTACAPGTTRAGNCTSATKQYECAAAPDREAAAPTSPPRPPPLPPPPPPFLLHSMRGFVDDDANRAAGKLFADTRQACSFICSTRHGSKYYSFNARLVADARGMFANSSAVSLPPSCICAAAGLLPRAMAANNTHVEDVACDEQSVPGWCTVPGCASWCTYTVRDPEIVGQRFQGLCLDGNGRPAAQP